MGFFSGWNAEDVTEWRSQQRIKRYYQDEVLQKLPPLNGVFQIVEYGQLDYAKLDQRYANYSLKALKSRDFSREKATVLVTGGVHGYETSGVQGAIRLCEQLCSEGGRGYLQQFNFIVLPCLSPWSYETINRWNPYALDPNRSFFAKSQVEKHAEESRLAQAFIHSVADGYAAHFDLHETTDTDNTVFRPALEARDAVEQPQWRIPDGFYLVGDTHRPAPAFQRAIIERVKTVTPIAPNDTDGNIIGLPASQEGVIYFDVKQDGLCIGMTDAPYVTTTEMYPDSPKVNPAQCIEAQVAAVLGGLGAL